MALGLGTLAGSITLGGMGLLIRSGVTYAISTFFISLIASLAIGVVSYAAITPLVDNVISQSLTYLDLPTQYKNFAGVLRLDQILTVWTSALSTRISITAMKRLRFKQ